MYVHPGPTILYLGTSRSLYIPISQLFSTGTIKSERTASIYIFYLCKTLPSDKTKLNTFFHPTTKGSKRPFSFPSSPYKDTRPFPYSIRDRFLLLITNFLDSFSCSSPTSTRSHSFLWSFICYQDKFLPPPLFPQFFFSFLLLHFFSFSLLPPSAPRWMGG